MDMSSTPTTAPFTDWMGVELVASAPGRVTLKLPPRPEFANRHGAIHGGVLATLLDSAMARAARNLDGVAELGGTVDLHVQFMRRASGALQASGWVEHQARTLAFARGEVRDADGQLVASGTCTLRLRRATNPQPACDAHLGALHIISQSSRPPP